MADLVAFPSLPKQAWSVFKGLEYAVRKQRSISGREFRMLDGAVPVVRWKLTYQLLRIVNQEFQTLEDFFLQAQGQKGLFLYKDPSDSSVVGGSLGEGDGSNRSFGLFRALFLPASVEPITLAVYFDGVLQSDTTYIVTDTGYINFDTPPGNGVDITVDLTFYYRVRFADDNLGFENFMFDLWELGELNIRTLVGSEEGLFDYLLSDHDVILDSDHDVHLTR